MTHEAIAERLVAQLTAHYPSYYSTEQVRSFVMDAFAALATGRAAEAPEPGLLDDIKQALLMHATNELVRSGKAPRRTKAWDGNFVLQQMAEALGRCLVALSSQPSPSPAPRHGDRCPYCANPGCVCDHRWGESCRCSANEPTPSPSGDREEGRA